MKRVFYVFAVQIMSSSDFVVESDLGRSFLMWASRQRKKNYQWRDNPLKRCEKEELPKPRHRPWMGHTACVELLPGSGNTVSQQTPSRSDHKTTEFTEIRSSLCFISLANPKSISLISSFELTRTFSVLMSRWAMLFWCKWSTARQISLNIFFTSKIYKRD